MGARTEILMTAWRRPQYLRKTLQSWAQVHGIGNVPMTVFLEPSDRQPEMLAVIDEARENGGLDIVTRVNPERLGVDVNILHGARRLFRENERLDYLIFAEEDLIVSTDVLDYLLWCDREFRERKDVLVACAHSDDYAEANADPAEVKLGQRFRCWVWSTWRSRWDEVLEPTWDADNSTSEYPGDPNDWAWNLDLRIIPRGGYRTVMPLASRSQNIGKWEGAHAAPGEYVKTLNPSFRAERERTDYKLVKEEPIREPGTRKHRSELPD